MAEGEDEAAALASAFAIGGDEEDEEDEDDLLGLGVSGVDGGDVGGVKSAPMVGDEEDALDAIFGIDDEEDGDDDDVRAVPAVRVGISGDGGDSTAQAAAAVGDDDDDAALDELGDLFDLDDEEEEEEAADLAIGTASATAAPIGDSADAGSGAGAGDGAGAASVDVLDDGETDVLDETKMDLAPPRVLRMELDRRVYDQAVHDAEHNLRQELASDFPDMPVIHHACRIGGVPDDLRHRVWPWLLRVQQAVGTDPVTTWRGVYDLAEQDTLRRDCNTVVATLKRGGITLGEGLDASGLEAILTFFCQRRAIVYTSELSKVLTVFCATCKTRGAVFNCFYAFVQQFAPRLYAGAPADGTAVEAQHLLVRNAVMFFDPALAVHLQRLHETWWMAASAGGCIPDRWLDFAFATEASPQALCLLWDAMMAWRHQGTHFAAFCVCAILVRERTALLALTTTGGDGSGTSAGGRALDATLDRAVRRALVMVHETDKAGVKAVVALARHMVRLTPPSARAVRAEDEAGGETATTSGTSGSTAHNGAAAPTSSAPRQAAASDCLVVDAGSVVPQLCLGRRALPSPVKNMGMTPLRYIVVDCRAQSLREAGRFATAFHVDASTCVPGHVRGTRAAADKAKGGSGSGSGSGSDSGSGSGSPASALTAAGVPLEECVRQLETTRASVYVCVMGTGVWHCRGAYRPNVVKKAIAVDDAVVEAVVRRFQRAGFPYVCVMRAGFSGAYRTMRNSAEYSLSSLVDFDADRCACCRHDKLVAFLKQQRGSGGSGTRSSFTVGSLLNKLSNRGKEEGGRGRSQSATGRKMAEGMMRKLKFSSNDSDDSGKAAASAARRGSTGTSGMEAAAAKAKGWFRRMSKSGSDSNTSRTGDGAKGDSGAGRGNGSGGNGGTGSSGATGLMSGRMAAFTSAVKERSATWKETLKKKLDDVGAAKPPPVPARPPVPPRSSDDGVKTSEDDGGDAKKSAALRALELAGLAVDSDFDLRKWDGTVRLFPCKQEKKSSFSTTTKLVPRYLALSKERLLVLAAHGTRLGHAVVRSNHHLTELAKLTYSKSQPHRLVLYYKCTMLGQADGDSGQQVPHAALRPRVFHVDDAAALVQALLAYIQAFK